MRPTAPGSERTLTAGSPYAATTGSAKWFWHSPLSLRFRSQLVSVPSAVWSLGGRSVRPRSLVEVAVIGPAATRVRLAPVDPGADATIFSDALAAPIGLDLTHAPQGSGSVVGGPKIPLRYAEVTLRITDGREQREWPARVGFTPVPRVYPL
jgi:hypothetical protein